LASFCQRGGTRQPPPGGPGAVSGDAWSFRQGQRTRAGPVFRTFPATAEANRLAVKTRTPSPTDPSGDLYQASTKAIRQVDTNHLILIKGNGWGNNYHGFHGPWDDNLVLGFHKY
jgi:hypothetical protein